jgi:hypothetical protein
MSGRRQTAKPAVDCPLDGRVRAHSAVRSPAPGVGTHWIPLQWHSKFKQWRCQHGNREYGKADQSLVRHALKLCLSQGRAGETKSHKARYPQKCAGCCESPQHTEIGETEGVSSAVAPVSRCVQKDAHRRLPVRVEACSHCYGDNYPDKQRAVAQCGLHLCPNVL